MSKAPRKVVPPKLPEELPWKPTDYTADDVYALKALVNGTASEHQQQHAVRFIIELCGTYDMEFRDTERASTFAGGKRFVGLQLVKLINLPAALIPERTNP